MSISEVSWSFKIPKSYLAVPPSHVCKIVDLSQGFADSTDTTDSTTNDFKDMTIKELKSLCKQHGLAFSGKRGDLLERLGAYTQQQQLCNQGQASAFQASDVSGDV